MIISLAAILALHSGLPQADGWVWSLYEGSRETVLAREIPDTDRLTTTLACAPGSGRITVSFYDLPPRSGFASFRSGDASGTAQMAAGEGSDPFALTIRTDHPAVANFTASGTLEVVAGDQTRTIAVSRPHLAKLRRFTEICAD
ncbi:MAG: hypothetical protein Q8S53_10695 [Brevundimonas sp.]|uniref:hypothetical protein n=1 Tax=Brevundimonas sp. TaxID=1871086 RepID=UPI002736416C|nr:hypothetical protein [Brevundimonas sp.]MDP3378822.1 hypothetical protein [Brevundimonas sp.]